MLEDLHLDDDLDFDEMFAGDRSTPAYAYWEKNYARLQGLLYRFRELALDESISLFQVGRLQQELDTALNGYVGEREERVRKTLRIKKLRNSASREPAERASYLAKAAELEREL